MVTGYGHSLYGLCTAVIDKRNFQDARYSVRDVIDKMGYLWFLVSRHSLYGRKTGVYRQLRRDNRNFQVARILCAMLSIRWVPVVSGFSAFLVRAENWCLQAVTGNRNFSGCTQDHPLLADPRLIKCRVLGNLATQYTMVSGCFKDVALHSVRWICPFKRRIKFFYSLLYRDSRFVLAMSANAIAI